MQPITEKSININRLITKLFTVKIANINHYFS